MDPLLKMRRHVATQRLLGANWPHNEFIMCEVAVGVWRLVLQTPSEFIKPHFSDAQLRFRAVARGFIP